jgi:hypothetical protein
VVNVSSIKHFFVHFLLIEDKATLSCFTQAFSAKG